MTEVERILQEYDRAMMGNAWHGEPVWTILDGITPECAAYGGTFEQHSIWQLVMHMNYWEEVATRRMKGPVVADENLNFPNTPESTGTNWQATLQRFRASNRSFRDAVSRLDVNHLDDTTPGGKRTFYTDALGVIQHHIYHAGQIALLKKIYEGSARRGL